MTSESSFHIAVAAKRLVEAPLFRNFILGTILFASVLVGVETSKEAVSAFGPYLIALDRIVLGIFTLEILVKLTAEARRPWRFFLDGWNVFDFAIVAMCYLPFGAQYIAVLRLVRILRVLRLVSVLPRLQLLVGALMKSLPSIGYVGLLLSIHFYIYAVLGNALWGSNDPARFGSLPLAFLTLFQCVTMEGWVDIMHTQMYGCASVGSGSLQQLCTNSQGMPIVAPIYFVSFIVLGTMIILNLFIGVMMTSLQEMQEERANHSNEQLRESKGSVESELAELCDQTSELTRRLKRLRGSIGKEF